MKKSIYLNFTIGYILFGFLSVVFLIFVTRHVVYDYLLNGVDQYLTTKGTYLQKEISASGDPVALADLFCDAMDFQLILISSQGEILSASQPQIKDQKIIPNFDRENFRIGNSFQGTLSNLLPESALIYTAGELSIMNSDAYLVVYTYISQVTKQTQALIFIALLTFGIIFIFSLIILIFFTRFVYRPIKQISNAATEFAKGNLQYQVLVVNNNDELGRLAASLNYMAAQLKNLEDDQKKFIANISHDFRSPLTSIKGYLEAMKDGTIPYEDKDKYIDTLLFETSRLEKLTQSLLTINTWEDGEHRLNLTDFSIKSEILQVIETMEVLSNKRKVLLSLIYEADSVIVRADKEKIEQVLYNLIENAIKFSRTNSEIQIRVFEKGERLFVSVKDNGTGILPEDLPKVFDRFYKGDISRGRDKSGTGLGLSIAKEIMQYHKESITVISTPGAGSEFTFSLKKAFGNHSSQRP